MTKEIYIEAGEYNGRYEILENGKIIRCLINSRGPVRITVGRGTKRHKAVLAAAERE